MFNLNLAVAAAVALTLSSVASAAPLKTSDSTGPNRSPELYGFSVQTGSTKPVTVIVGGRQNRSPELYGFDFSTAHDLKPVSVSAPDIGDERNELYGHDKI